MADTRNIFEFELERSNDAISWQPLARIAAAESKLHYDFSDEAPLSGISYYRLKLKFADQSASYSNILSALRGENASETCNVATIDVGHYEIVCTEKIESIDLYDYAGKKITDFTQDGRFLNLSRLPAGVYLLRVYSETGVWIRKVVKY
jgi:hypothetical protein